MQPILKDSKAIVNVANKKRKIYLFTRDWTGKQTIYEDDSFYPFYYEPDINGEYIGYDGTKLKKIICSEPADIRKQKSAKAYSADVIYTDSYLINKVDKLEKTYIKYFFIDIEVLCTDLPDPMKATEPVSCVTIYNSFNKEYKTWWLPNYKGNEIKMLHDIMSYIQVESPDLLLAWNIDFDYIYLHQRFNKLEETNDFAKKISPISFMRYGNSDDILYPCGISVLDYLAMFKKISPREKSYTLDSISQKYIKNEESWGKQDFSSLDDTVMEKNINDVRRLVLLEEQFNVLTYYDEIRIFSKSQWESITSNSLVIDSILLEEAKNRNIVLPSKPERPKDSDIKKKRETFEGAYRRADEGVFFDIYKADVASMYPNQLVNFCLDPKNITDKCSEDTVLIDKTYFKQDSNALLPFLGVKFMKEKDALKKQLKRTAINTEEYNLLQRKYDAYKGLVNSLFGVCGYPFFRLYNNLIAGTIAYLARDLLHFVEEKMKMKGHEVIYTDTDSLFYKADKDEIEYLNRLVQVWGAEKYDKPDVEITFETEGKFDRILVLGKCHYYGYITSSKGSKKEIKGVEAKRSSSSRYESWFQEELINKVLNKETKESIIKWIQNEQDRIKTLALEEISFPAKIGNAKYEKNTPIFLRAFNNSKKIFPTMNITKGELFYYIFIKNTKENNVLAFTNSEEQLISRRAIDWDNVIRRNIISKADAIFNAMNWNLNISLSNQMTLF